MELSNLTALAVTLVAALTGGFLLGKSWRDIKPLPLKIQEDEEESHFAEHSKKISQILPGELVVKQKVNLESRNVVIAAFNLPVKIKKVQEKWEITWKNSRDFIRNFHNDTSKMKVKFVGFPGIFPSPAEREELEELLLQYDCYPVWIEEDLYEKFFSGFCKEILWPLFHYFTPSLKAGFAKRWDMLWQAYNSVNMSFSRKVLEISEEDNETIWVHNYHLLLLPSFIRRRLPRAKIGIFVHTPFPTSDLYRCLPARANILRALLCADLIGFQTYDYARHFISALKRILDLDFQTMPGGALGIIYSGRSVTIRINHVGISANTIRELRSSDAVSKKAVEFKLKHEGRKIILAVDDLDPVKGTLCKVQSYSLFLDRYPEWVDKVVLVNVLSGSSASEEEQQSLKQQILAEVDDVHLKFGDKVLEIVDGNATSLDDLVAMYSISDVGLFSTFWDGLNVCPYEYTASQDPENPGALIVSEFMGCSRSLSGVTSVNPWKLDQVGEAIYSSLNMSSAERRAHHLRRSEYVMKHAFTDWCSGFLTDLDEASLQAVNLSYIQVGWGSNARLIALNSGFSHLEESDITPAYRSSKKRLLLLDYDGTLTAESNPELAAPSEQLIKVLRILSEDPYNYVFILSGRERKVLEKWFGCLPKLGLAAEKGVYYKWPSSDLWQNDVSVKDFEWKKAVKQLMKAYTERTDGTYIEPKESALVWHYEGADPEYGKMQASELAKYLQKVVEGWHGVEVVKYDYNRILEVKPKGINKGVTTQRILRQLQKNGETPQFILAVGDDRSDEEVFMALQETLKVPADASTPVIRTPLATSPVRYNERDVKDSGDTQLYTICVGIKPSNAKFYLNDPQEVVNVMTSLSVLSAKFLRRMIAPENTVSPMAK